MKRLISAKYCTDHVRIAYFEDLELKKFENFKNSSNDKFESIEEAIKKFTNKNNYKIYKLALNMEDNECISQHVTIDNKDEKTFVKNIKYQFSDFINEDEFDDYVFDFQRVDFDKTNSEFYVVAAPKNKVEAYLGVAISLNKKLDMLRPEAASIGSILSDFNAGGVIVIDLGLEEINIRVFNNKKLLATSVLPEDYKKSLGKIAVNIVKTIVYYDEKKISNRDYKILIIGDNAHLLQIRKGIEKLCHHGIISPRDFIKGRCSEEEAAGVFSMYGILF